MSYKKENATIITKRHPHLNFGQTGEILDFNEFSDEVFFSPHGEKKKYWLHYTEVWPASRSHEFEACNRALELLEDLYE